MNPAIKPYFRKASTKRPRASTTDAPWMVAALCAAYQWPTSAPGGGTIAIVELGGGWVQSDLAAFFKANGQPVPNVTDVSVDGTKNTPTAGSDSADYEVALDIEVAAAAYYVATGGKVASIRVYWSQDIASAVAAAAKDGCAVCSISWGADEADWGSADLAAMENAAAAATMAGMIVFAASGDNDADDSTNHTAVDAPASCPHVVGCGGTSKAGAPAAGGLETVWNNDTNPSDPSGEGTGGGYSTVFPAQTWQAGAPKAPSGLGRMVPDVAANADPNTGYEIYCHGSSIVIGGTSAVAPLYAGLFAALGKGLGFVTPTLWAHPGAFSDITGGGNGLYKAATGPDPCTGLGAPIGSSIAVLFTAAAAPTQPPTPSPAPPTPTAAPTSQEVLAAAQVAIAKLDPLADHAQIMAALTAALPLLWPST